jgi:hypothetical protein
LYIYRYAVTPPEKFGMSALHSCEQACANLTSNRQVCQFHES